MVVRSDDEHLKGISVFSHGALMGEQLECYHIVMPGQGGQESRAAELEEIRT